MYEDFSRVVHHKSALEKIPGWLSTKMETTKSLTKRVFSAHKKSVSFFIFIQLNLVPRSFLLEKGKSPGDKVVFLATDHELVNLYTVAKTTIYQLNTLSLGTSRFISATFHLSFGEYL